MSWFNDDPTGRMVQSWLKVFVSTILSMYLADLVSGAGAFDMTNAYVYLSAGIVSVLPLVINYLNPAYTRYGNGAVEEAPVEVVEVFDEEEYKGE